MRKATREEKKKKAMAMREKELGALGLQVNEKGQVIAKTSLLTEMEALVEEAGLKCCICLEGYKNQPAKVSIDTSIAALRMWCYDKNIVMIFALQLLGVYTFTRKVTLDEFETKPRKTSVCCNCMHSLNSFASLSLMCRGMQLFPISTVSTMSVTQLLSSELFISQLPHYGLKQNVIVTCDIDWLATEMSGRVPCYRMPTPSAMV